MKGEVGMAAPRSTLTRKVGIITHMVYPNACFLHKKTMYDIIYTKTLAPFLYLLHLVANKDQRMQWANYPCKALILMNTCTSIHVP